MNDKAAWWDVQETAMQCSVSHARGHAIAPREQWGLQRSAGPSHVCQCTNQLGESDGVFPVQSEG